MLSQDPLKHLTQPLAQVPSAPGFCLAGSCVLLGSFPRLDNQISGLQWGLALLVLPAATELSAGAQLAPAWIPLGAPDSPGLWHTQFQLSSLLF